MVQLQSIKGVHDDVHRARGYEGDCPCLHIDVHGAQDPAVGGRHAAHLHLGLAAMEGAGRPDVEVFRDALQGELERLFWRGWQRTDLGGFPLVDPRPARLTGALHPASGRSTLTQSSVKRARFTHAVQLELSHRMRVLLFKTPPLREQFARAIHEAWRQTVAVGGAARGGAYTGREIGQVSEIGQVPARSRSNRRRRAGASPRRDNSPARGGGGGGSPRKGQAGASPRETATQPRRTSPRRVRPSDAPVRLPQVAGIRR